MKKTTAIAVFLAALMWFPTKSRAYDRYARGRTLYFRRCGPCFDMGWQWAPKPIQKPLNLAKMARTWTPAQVCTWMRKNSKKLVPPGCYPGRIGVRDKLDILYYIKRKTEGPVHKPMLKAIFRRLTHRIRLAHTTRARRQSALRTYKNLKEMLRLKRHRIRRRPGWSGNVNPPTKAPAPKTRRTAR